MSQYQDDAVKKVQDAWEEGVRDPSVNIFCGRGKSFFLNSTIGEGIDINCTHVVIAPANCVNVVQKLGRCVHQNREEERPE
jgi:hypothetical protein